MIIRDVTKACLDRNGIFSLSSIVAASGHERVKVRRAMEKLEREGHVVRVAESETPLPGPTRGRPIKESRYAARSSLKARLADMECVVQKETALDRIWRAIRQLRRFTRHGLMVTADASPENVRAYTMKLRRAGYVKLIDRDTWTLIKDPGPKRPNVKETA
jgi:hypothetical protein